ncbi:MAG: hypothetical protein ACYC1Z_15135 [Georgenia sp.]
MALPLYPQAGTEPNVYYVPPMYAPRGYLRQMFGPNVDEALEADQRLATDDDLVDLTVRIVHSFEVEDEIAISHGGSGDGLVSVPLRGPTFICEFFAEMCV